MKSEKAKEYLASICNASAMLYEGEPEECDLKLKEAKHAVELAEEEMAEKAVNLMDSIIKKTPLPEKSIQKGLLNMFLNSFKQKLME